MVVEDISLRERADEVAKEAQEILGNSQSSKEEFAVVTQKLIDCLDKFKNNKPQRSRIFQQQQQQQQIKQLINQLDQHQRIQTKDTNLSLKENEPKSNNTFGITIGITSGVVLIGALAYWILKGKMKRGENK
ncbi:hypothetical protein [endosymbiont GvMRE of Glomus versiforme]|uniref:hypothetical protein n=1 Tax=endosymbiont GvMRE of Glomus versiforme TaxID=2039283 RepID=UPI0011C477FC|nr:hypothetical protein [endosymbiont GvMRE of Glomus versiforme]